VGKNTNVSYYVLNIIVQVKKHAGHSLKISVSPITPATVEGKWTSFKHAKNKIAENSLPQM